MTQEEYKNDKKKLEQQIQELDQKWREENEEKYSVNVGKYYRKDFNNDIGIICGYSSGFYLCKEIECDSGGLYIESFQEYNASFTSDDYLFITKEEFDKLLDKRVQEIKDKITKEFKA